MLQKFSCLPFPNHIPEMHHSLWLHVVRRQVKNVSTSLAPEAVHSLLDSKELRDKLGVVMISREKTVRFGALSME